jgi:hypothetical protein
VLVRELLELERVGQHRAHGGLGVRGSQRRRALDRAQLPVDARQRRDWDFEVEVGASELNERAEGLVNVEHDVSHRRPGACA